MADSPNSSRVVAAEPPLDPRDSSSVGGQLRKVITTNDGGFTRSDVIGDEEGAIASGDSVNSRDQMTAYDQIRRNSDTEDDDDDENDGWRGAGPATSFRTTSFRRFTRARRPNVRLQAYEIDIPVDLVIEAVNELMEPQSVEEALQGPDADKWEEALKKEHADLKRNNTWVLVDCPKGKKILTRKWVFVKKRNPDGTVIRYRARITITGCQQEYDINFWETYSPVVSFEAVKLVLLLALHYGLLCEQIDFVTVFLNGPIGGDVEIYM
ncbi:hypothetical protein PI124_g18686 [Phytophthora idaei]|nr:hypothetical protein PI125_g20901 [Phytophthora idaei]KAG3133032.1 hypothetical protein PI126_g19349 [Phytophthora idaei]KAG3236305.1 hypothetical protein PI124_g18686 [Phytophthora idaei]